MEYFTSLIPETLSKAIGFTVLHSLWQICLVSLIYYIVVKLFVKDNSRAKYNLAIISLFSSLTISVISFIYFFIEYKTVSNASNPLFGQSVISQNFANTFVSGKFSFDKFIQENLSLISGLWLMGSALFFAKFSSGVLGLYNLKHNAVSSSDKRLAYLMNGLKKKLNITEEVSILESHNIISPVVLGYARPLILFPVAMCSQLSINELESVIAHELAHIKRNDFIINLLQSCTEAILYYHPLVWWLCKIIREERENCCDDMAISVTSDKLSYAKTLLKIQELSSVNNTRLALAFSGNNKQFKNRIMRILNQPSSSQFLREKLIAVALLFSFIIAFAHNDHTLILPEDKADCQLEDILSSEKFSDLDYSLIIEDDTLPNKKNTLKVFKQKNNEDVEISIENGEIKRFKVNGKDVPKEEIGSYSDVIEIEKDGDIKVWGDSLRFNNRSYDIDIDADSWFNHRGPNNEEISILIEENMKNLTEVLKDHDFSLAEIEDTKIQLRNLGDRLGHIKLPKDSGTRFFQFSNGEDIDVDALLAEVLPKTFMEEYFSSPNGNNLQIERFLSDGNDISHRISGGNSLKDKISRSLAKDGFLIEGKNKVELSGKHMKINGEKQAKNIWNKYRKIYEKNLGTHLTKDSKVFFDIEYEENNKRFFESI
jgi:beta-lactamase regulating signal transducer with metallopeptidase domain